MRINLPPVTRALLLLTFFISSIYTIARWTPATRRAGADTSNGSGKDTTAPSTPLVPYLALIPSLVFFYPWTLLTSTFVEQNIITLTVNGVAVFFGGRYLERAWGSKGFATMVGIATVVPNLLVIPTYIIWGAITGSTTRANTPITGAITLQAAFLVAFKQLVPEHTVSVYKGLLKIRVKHFPAIFLLLNTIGGILFGTDTALLLGWYGLVTTWAYLRFSKRQPDLSGTSTSGVGVKGDASETFAFATFFPNVLQPPIAAVCDQLYILLCNLRVITPFSDEAIASGNEQAAARGEGGLPSLLNSQSRGGAARHTSKREETERRRALALKALDERLSAASSQTVQVLTSDDASTVQPEATQADKAVT